MSAPKPTAGPWAVERAQRGYIITALDGQYDVAVVRDLGLQDNGANAAHIVNCVNSHDELVAALQAARSEIWRLLEVRGIEPKKAAAWPEIIAADAALARARGQQ